MHPSRSLATLGLTVALAVTACSGGSGSDAAGSGSGSTGPRSGGAAAEAPTSSPGTARDACQVLDAATIAEVADIDVQDGRPGASLGDDSRCEFTTTTDGIDVAVQVGHAGSLPGGQSSPLLTEGGFEDTFGPSKPIDGLAREAFGALDDTLSVGQAAVVSSDGEVFTLVTLTGFDLTDADIDRAADLVAAAEGDA